MTRPPTAGSARWCLSVMVVVVAGVVAGGCARAHTTAAHSTRGPTAQGFTASAPAVPVSFAPGTRVSTLPELGERGAYVVGYDHDGDLAMSFPISNPGPGEVVVAGVRLDTEPLSLLVILEARVGGRPLPATLGAGESTRISLRGRFGNCRYYQERELEIVSEVLVEVGAPSAGIQVVQLAHDLVIRSPMIIGCPDRTLDREDDLRPPASPLDQLR